jgi:hypothetical protein
MVVRRRISRAPRKSIGIGGSMVAAAPVAQQLALFRAQLTAAVFQLLQ